jgi:head-tail adaptor
LAAMRTMQASTLTDMVTITRASSSSDGMGGYSDAWATAITTTCRVAPISSRDLATLGGKVFEGALVRVTLPASTAIDVADRISVGARAFDVLAISAHTAETARVCICAER